MENFYNENDIDHSEWTHGAGRYIPVPWVQLQKMVSVAYDGIPYQVKQRACDRGITAENMEKSLTAYRFQQRYD